MKRSKHSLSHSKLFTCDMAELIPIAWFETLPGDTIQHVTRALLRVSPLLTPVMHPVHVRIHHWFVPLRLIWDGFEDFITGGPDGSDDTIPPYRQLNGATVTEGGLNDYFGVPPATYPAVDYRLSALPHRAYSLIWNEWYRDQDLQTELVVSKASGQDTTSNVALQKCDWEKDYFTSARPWPIKGDAVLVPMSGAAQVKDLSGQFVQTAAAVIGATTARGLTDTVSGDLGASQTLFADLTAGVGVGISINDLRESMALQRYAEARARYGSRYTEYLRYLGVRSSDARLQRPEYLGGGRQTIQFSEVLQTSPTTSGTPNIGVAELKGHGIAAMRSNRYRRFFEEHGIVMTLFSVRPKTMYTQGLHRSWSRATRMDYFQRELAHIGQQEVQKKEVWAHAAAPTDTWGYQDRYDEYRRMESSVAGEFRSTLNMWHYARIFSGEPALNAAFVSADPTKRVNVVQNADVLWCMAAHSIQARRMVPKEGTSFGF